MEKYDPDKKYCDVVSDLIPLYVDGACSTASRIFVDEHIKECDACRNLLDNMKTDEIEKELAEERKDVIKRQSGIFKRKSFAAGAIIAGIFMIPILVCFIVNLAGGAGLTWFFVVLSSLLFAACLIVVPLMVPANKFLWLSGTGTASLILLLGVCCLYTKGDWFFTAASSTLFGLSVVLLPFVLSTKTVRKYIKSQRGLIAMAVDSIFFWLMMLSIGLTISKDPMRAFDSVSYWYIVEIVAVPLFVFAWVIFVLLRYPRCSKLARAGFAVIATGAMGFLIMLQDLPKFYPLTWNIQTIDGNVEWAFVILCIIIGIGLIIGGIVRDAKKKKQST